MSDTLRFSEMLRQLGFEQGSDGNTYKSTLYQYWMSNNPLYPVEYNIATEVARLGKYGHITIKEPESLLKDITPCIEGKTDKISILTVYNGAIEKLYISVYICQDWGESHLLRFPADSVEFTTFIGCYYNRNMNPLEDLLRERYATLFG